MRLKELRKQNNFTQKDVAISVGISVQVYSRYERCERQADYETLAKFANFFGVSIDYLLGFANLTQGAPNTNLTVLEQELLQKFRQLSKQKQDAFVQLLK